MSLIPSIFGGRSNALDVWDPFREWPISTGDEASQLATCIDWKETTEAHEFKADLPGLKKEEVEEGNALQISGERTRENEEKNDTCHRVQRSSGKFLGRFRLPENAKMNEVKAIEISG